MRERERGRDTEIKKQKSKNSSEMRVHVCECVCACVYVRNVENECIAYIGLFFIFLTKYDACLILLHVTIFILKCHQLLSFHRIKKQNKKKKKGIFEEQRIEISNRVKT